MWINISPAVSAMEEANVISVLTERIVVIKNEESSLFPEKLPMNTIYFK